MYLLFTAPRTRGTRVVWTFEELALDYELRIHAPRDNEIRTLNPLRKLPVLVEEDLVLTESAAICTYLADRHRDRQRLSPAFATETRARYDAWNFYTLTDLEAPVWTYTKHALVYPEKVRVPEILPDCGREFQRSCAALAEKLGDDEFLLGDTFSVCDVLCAHTLAWARSLDFETGETSVDRYADRVLARPALARARARERQAAALDADVD